MKTQENFFESWTITPIQKLHVKTVHSIITVKSVDASLSLGPIFFYTYYETEFLALIPEYIY